MPNSSIMSESSISPVAAYSPEIKGGNTIYVSGMVALDEKGNVVGKNNATAQTHQVLESIKNVIEAAGGTMADIVFNMIFLKDFADYPKMNAVYAEYFPKNPPARYCVRADLEKSELLVEITSIAHLSSL
jgi:aminoacrylate peracid reductase